MFHNLKQSANLSLFDLNCQEKDSQLIVIPVPWDITTSYRKGTSLAAKAILESSNQIDHYHHYYPNFHQYGIHMIDIPADIIKLNQKLNDITQQIVNHDCQKKLLSDTKLNECLELVSAGTKTCFDWIHSQLNNYSDKQVIVLGGEHSVSYPAISFFKKKHPQLSVLQIDAHMDLRPSYQQLTYSHAAVIYHCHSQLNIPITQVGIRDSSQSELDYVKKHDNIHVFDDTYCQHQLFKGVQWDAICDDIINTLSDDVYITIDIDGLDSSFCPSTGTPVPGGMSYHQLCYLIQKIRASNKRIISMDLVEVAGFADSIGIINSTHLLYQLCGYLMK